MKYIQWITAIIFLLVKAPVAYCDRNHDDRRQLPEFFNNSWVGLTSGNKKTPFSSRYYYNDYDFGRVKDNIGALRLTIGHYFTPQWAIAASLMRGVHANFFSQAVQSGAPVLASEKRVSESTFAITVLPTYWLNHLAAVYAEAGLAMTSRHGFKINDQVVVKDGNVLSGLIGGGVLFRVEDHLLLNINSIYTPKNNKKMQPSIWYLGVGLSHLISAPVRHHLTTSAIFPLHELTAAYTNDQWFYWDVAKYFTPPRSIPIFFDGHIKISRGLALFYQTNFFHTERYFSMDWGVSAGQWRTRATASTDHFYTLSLYPEIKIWFYRSPFCDLYFTYSLAGPTFISKRFFNGVDSGSHFTFQDFLGFGIRLGRTKNIGANLRIVHYSNGNTLPSNPGVDVPVMASLSIAY